MIRFSTYFAVLLGCLSTVVFGAEPNKVDQLAREGYWGEKETWPAHAKLLNQPAPKLEIAEWRGRVVKAQEMKGKIVIIDFWATWCGPCKEAVPHNNELVKKYADRGVLLIGACGGGREERMSPLFEQLKMAYPTGKVTRESTDAWGVQWWPFYAVIDAQGNVRAVGLRPDAIEKVIDALLEEAAAKKTP